MPESPPYRRALDALPHIVWVGGPDGTIEYLNRRCSEYAGIPTDDLLGWDWGWIVHPSDLTATLRVWNSSLRVGAAYEAEQRLRRHDGEYRWFLVRGEPVRGEDGQVVRWFGTCTDIDDHKRAVEQFRASRGLFRALVERSGDGMMLVGADGTVRYANPEAGRLLGFAAEDLAGTDAWSSVHADDRAALAEWLDGLADSPSSGRGLRVRLRRGRGDELVEVVGQNLLRDPDVRAYAVVLRPVPGASSEYWP